MYGLHTMRNAGKLKAHCDIRIEKSGVTVLGPAALRNAEEES